MDIKGSSSTLLTTAPFFQPKIETNGEISSSKNSSSNINKSSNNDNKSLNNCLKNSSNHTSKNLKRSFSESLKNTHIDIESKIKTKPKWGDLSNCQKAKKVAKIVILVLAIATLLLIFFVSVSLVGKAFLVLVGQHATSFFNFAKKPSAGLCIGILATILFQSSSTTTSLTVSLVASNALTVGNAVAIIMGANIGTSVTNTIVSFGYVKDRKLFRKATEGATVHDFFNVFLVLFFLPIEQIPISVKGDTKGLLETISYFIVSPIPEEKTHMADLDFFKMITKPMVEIFLKISPCIKNKTACPEEKLVIGGIFSALPDKTAAGISVGIAIFIMCLSLYSIAKLMSRALKKQSSNWIKRALLRHSIVAMLIGFGMTIVMQSSSITTTTLVPLVALEVITLEQMFPLTLGANVGTTVTAFIAALAAGEKNGLQIAVIHFLFNFLGVLIFYPIKYIRSLPLTCAEILGYYVNKNRLFGIIYVLGVFIFAPLILFGFSFCWPVDIVFICLVYLVLFFTYIWRQIRIRWPEKIPLWCPSLMKPNGREAEEAIEIKKEISNSISVKIELPNSNDEKININNFDQNNSKFC